MVSIAKMSPTTSKFMDTILHRRDYRDGHRACLVQQQHDCLVTPHHRETRSIPSWAGIDGNTIGLMVQPIFLRARRTTLALLAGHCGSQEPQPNKVCRVLFWRAGVAESDTRKKVLTALKTVGDDLQSSTGAPASDSALALDRQLRVDRRAEFFQPVLELAG